MTVKLEILLTVNPVGLVQFCPLVLYELMNNVKNITKDKIFLRIPLFNITIITCFVLLNSRTSKFKKNIIKSKINHEYFLDLCTCV